MAAGAVVRVPLALVADGYSIQLVRAHLEEVVRTDPHRVLLAWGLSSLGFGAENAIAEHFSAFGGVKKVAVALPEMERQDGSDFLRIEPGYVGFVIMDSELSASRALAAGGAQRVCGVSIRVRNFGEPGVPAPAEKPTALIGTGVFSSNSLPSVDSTSATSGENSPVFSAPGSLFSGASPRGDASPRSGSSGCQPLPLDCNAISRRLEATVGKLAGQKAALGIADALRVWSVPQ